MTALTEGGALQNLSLYIKFTTIILWRVKSSETFETVSCSCLPERKRFQQGKRSKNGNMVGTNDLHIPPITLECRLGLEGNV